MPITTNANMLGFRASKYSKNKGNLTQATGGVGKGFIDKQNSFSTEADIPDPYINNTTILLKANNSYANSKAGGPTINSTGVSFDSTIKRWGSHSFYFNGTYDIKLQGTHAALTGDFCFETWVYLNNYNTNGSVLLDMSDSSYSQVFYINVDGKLQCYVYGNGATPGAGTVALPLNTWGHCAFTRIGSTWTLYLNGVATSSSSGGTGSLGNAGNYITMGSGYANGYSSTVRGYMDEIRLTVGNGRYTGNFTPPTGPFASS
jgi:hypothetical protein